MKRRTTSRSRGFTLIEILIVVIILGILAAIVIPQFSEASDDAAQSAATATAQTLQSQVELYKFKVNSYPAAATWQADLLAAGYISATPTMPSGWSLSYTEATGRVTATQP